MKLVSCFGGKRNLFRVICGEQISDPCEGVRSVKSVRCWNRDLWVNLWVHDGIWWNEWHEWCYLLGARVFHSHFVSLYLFYFNWWMLCAEWCKLLMYVMDVEVMFVWWTLSWMCTCIFHFVWNHFYPFNFNYFDAYVVICMLLVYGWMNAVIILVFANPLPLLFIFFNFFINVM